MLLVSLGLAFQIPDLHLMSIEKKSVSLLNEDHKKSLNM